MPGAASQAFLKTWNTTSVVAAPAPVASASLRGAHAVVQGTSDTTGATTANDVFTDVAENPVVGRVTAAPASCSVIPPTIAANTIAGQEPARQRVTCSGNPLTVEGREVVQLSEDDNLLPGGPPTDTQGFVINPSTIKPMAGVIAEVNGYYGSDGKVHYHSLLVTAGAPVNSAIAEAAITRASCTSKDGKLDVRGGVHNAKFASVAGMRVSIYTVPLQLDKKGNPLATATAVDAGVMPLEGTFRWDGNVNVGINRCPTR